MNDQEGLVSVEEAYRNRIAKAQDLRHSGQKIVGYFCGLVPVEMLTAAGLVPFRITGDAGQAITVADAHLETTMCSFVRSAFDLALNGRYDFLDGLVVPHSCDTIVKVSDIWQKCRPVRYSHFINFPHMAMPSSFEFLEAELGVYKRSLERYTGVELSNERLNRAIELHNENRRLIRALNELRKVNPPLVSGSDMVKAQVAAKSLPVGQSNRLIETIIEEARTRQRRPETQSVRLLMYGAEVDDPVFTSVVEETGAKVVIDATCVGSRDCWDDVNVGNNPLAELANRYLAKVHCPRTCRSREGSHKEDLENRFGYLKTLAKDFRADGAIIYSIRFCDTHELDVPDVKEYLESIGLATMTLEDEYGTSSAGKLRTMLQAFVEMTTKGAA